MKRILTLLATFLVVTPAIADDIPPDSSYSKERWGISGTTRNRTGPLAGLSDDDLWYEWDASQTAGTGFHKGSPGVGMNGTCSGVGGNDLVYSFDGTTEVDDVGETIAASTFAGVATNFTCDQQVYFRLDGTATSFPYGDGVTPFSAKSIDANTIQVFSNFNNCENGTPVGNLTDVVGTLSLVISKGSTLPCSTSGETPCPTGEQCLPMEWSETTVPSPCVGSCTVTPPANTAFGQPRVYSCNTNDEGFGQIQYAGELRQFSASAWNLGAGWPTMGGLIMSDVPASPASVAETVVWEATFSLSDPTNSDWVVGQGTYDTTTISNIGNVLGSFRAPAQMLWHQISVHAGDPRLVTSYAQWALGRDEVALSTLDNVSIGANEIVKLSVRFDHGNSLTLAPTTSYYINDVFVYSTVPTVFGGWGTTRQGLSFGLICGNTPPDTLSIYSFRVYRSDRPTVYLP